MSLVAPGTLVRDLMTEALVTCSVDADLASVALILARHHVHAVFVVGEDELPVGVLSDFDMLAGEWLGDDVEGLSIMKAITAGEMMTAPVEAIEADAMAATAAITDARAAPESASGDWRRGQGSGCHLRLRSGRTAWPQASWQAHRSRRDELRDCYVLARDVAGGGRTGHDRTSLAFGRRRGRGRKSCWRDHGQ